jgi:uncharacterized membrane protein
LHPSYVIPLSHLNYKFWIAIIYICFISTPFETIFYYEALKEEDISLVIPILSLAPALTIVFSFFLLREIPTFLGTVGVLCIVLGIYALKIGQAKEGILQPIHHLRNSRGVRLMALVMVSLALGSVFDKLGVTNSNAYFYTLVNYIGVCISLLIIACVKARSHLKDLFIHAKSFFVIGIFVAGYTLLYSLALEAGSAFYVVSIRNASILFTMLFSYLFLKEKGLKEKLFAGFLIFIGLVCINIFG